MNRWENKAAIVTGAASGIGNAIATELLKRKVNVLALDVNAAKLSAASDEWKRLRNCGKFYIKRCDTTNEQDLDEAFSFVDKEWNGPNILVNAAGIFYSSRIIDSNRETLERLLNVNVLGTTLCIIRAVSLMRQRNVEGHIFNINSVVGHYIPFKSLSNAHGYDGLHLYPASKHATVALTESVRRELVAVETPIRITSISPGFVKTNLIHIPPDSGITLDRYPMIEPVDIADGVMYALSTRPEVTITEMKIQPTREL